ncbi:hypothetical protein ABZ656_09330 [Streptomyces sp. NPDC007095]|uniref:hypothetical protein n=1 Tax=Streptomyces sp. NPDC007095 TaxID=3154482 RepID=UPI0033F769CC
MAAYRKRFGVRPVERFAVEAYYALLFVAQGLRELGNVEVEQGVATSVARPAAADPASMAMARTVPSDMSCHLVRAPLPQFQMSSSVPSLPWPPGASMQRQETWLQIETGSSGAFSSTVVGCVARWNA